MNKAAMIFPGHISEELKAELNSNIAFYNAVLDEAVKIALECEKNGVDVIISRAGSAAAIKQAVKVPVVNCEVTHSDLIDSILNIKANFYPKLKEIGLINYANVSYDVSHIEQLTNIKVKQSWYWSGEKDLKERVVEYKKDGLKVIMGASMTVKFAQELDMKGFLMQIGRETLKQATQKAKEILEIRSADLAYSEKIKNMLSFAREGIIFVDEKNVIEYANPQAAQTLGTTANELKNQPIGKIFKGWEENDANIKLNQITQAFNNHIIYNCAPVNVKDKKVGEVITFTETAQIQHVEEKIRKFLYQKGFVAKYAIKDIIGDSSAIKESIKKVQIYGKTDSSVLIIGETGTGKELFAHSLHQESLRKNHPFLAINCAALPENLLESELFGYTDGAFTGARKGGRAGYFELAHRGTLFLDEIGELRPAMQGKLLRAIQEKEIMRIGDDKIIPVDTRIIAATNQNLLEQVKNKNFRSDLFYRLNALKINIPPLRERSGDLPLLVKHFIDKFIENSKTTIPFISKNLLDTLAKYDWPGNVRELEFMVNKYCLLVHEMGEQSIFEELYNKECSHDDDKQNNFLIKIGTMAQMQDNIYEKIYKLANNNKSKTAQILGVNRITVAKWLEKRNT